MSKKRYIDTRFWDDNFITELDPIEKLLFIYFLTNPLLDICGIYETAIKRIAFDTGIDKDMVSKIIKRFSVADKIYYIDGWIYIKNFARHQAVNPKIEIGIKRSKKLVPNEIMTKISNIGIGYDSLSKPSNYSNLNLNLNSNLNLTVVASEKTDTTFNFQDKLELMKKNKDKRFQIIALYWEYNLMESDNKEKYSSMIKRELKPSAQLKGYDLKDIYKTFEHLNSLVDLPKWTLETVFKYIDDVIAQNKYDGMTHQEKQSLLKKRENLFNNL